MKKYVLAFLLLAISISVAYSWDGVSGQINTVGRKTVTTKGTAVALSSTSQRCSRIYVTALSTDLGVIAVGNSNVVAASANVTGLPLNAGESAIFPGGDLNSYYIDSTVNGEGVSFVCFD